MTTSSSATSCSSVNWRGRSSAMTVRRSSPYFAVSSSRSALMRPRMRRGLADELDRGLVLLVDLLALETGQAAELHLQDRPCLGLAEAELLLEARERGLRRLARANGLDDLVDVIERDLEPLEDVRTLFGLGEVVFSASADD